MIALAALTALWINRPAPFIEGIVPRTVYNSDTPELLSGISAVSADGREVEISVDTSEVDFEKEGVYQISYTAQDKLLKKSSAQTTLEVVFDTEPPKIEGLSDISVFIGDTVSYKKDVTVTDDRDSDPALLIDNSQVNLKEDGEYPVVYTARDAAGNEATNSITVTVVESDEDGYSPEILNEMLDETLSRIISPDMTDDEKLRAVFFYVKRNIYYSGWSDKSDWRKGAFFGLSRRSGDCYTYYSTARALLDRCGFETLPVERTGGISDHYWLLVQYEGKWYHYDAGISFNGYDANCMMWTDAQMANYASWIYRGMGLPNFYTYDQTLLPEVSTEEYQP
ncbi:MAG: hypothetical protein Q4B42_02005 [Oscillospiraceae bacterium]|nr:hypothetical protein [Oscillospiraceae bacterium]